LILAKRKHGLDQLAGYASLTLLQLTSLQLGVVTGWSVGSMIGGLSGLAAGVVAGTVAGVAALGGGDAVVMMATADADRAAKPLFQVRCS
jgi:hypothetical protein